MDVRFFCAIAYKCTLMCKVRLPLWQAAIESCSTTAFTDSFYESVFTPCCKGNQIAKTLDLNDSIVWIKKSEISLFDSGSDTWCFFISFTRRMVVFWLTLLLLHHIINHWIWRLCGPAKWKSPWGKTLLLLKLLCPRRLSENTAITWRV